MIFNLLKTSEIILLSTLVITRHLLNLSVARTKLYILEEAIYCLIRSRQCGSQNTETKKPMLIWDLSNWLQEINIYRGIGSRFYISHKTSPYHIQRKKVSNVNICSSLWISYGLSGSMVELQHYVCSVGTILTLSIWLLKKNKWFLIIKLQILVFKQIFKHQRSKKTQKRGGKSSQEGLNHLSSEYMPSILPHDHWVRVS